jgi:hypothetical protein
MYLELITTVTALQNGLANAYSSSDRMPEIGLYFLAMNQATVEFFKYVEHPKALGELHEAFMEWQTLGIVSLREELDPKQPVSEETSRAHIQASDAFAQALAEATSPDE